MENTNTHPNVLLAFRNEKIAKMSKLKKHIKHLDVEIETLSELKNKSNLTDDDERALYNGFTSAELQQLWHLSRKIKKEATWTEIINELVRFIICIILLLVTSTTMLMAFINDPNSVSPSLPIIVAVLLLSTFSISRFFYLVKPKKNERSYNELNTILSKSRKPLPIVELSHNVPYEYKSKVLPEEIKDLLSANFHFKDDTIIKPNNHDIVSIKYENAMHDKDTDVAQLNELSHMIKLLDHIDTESL